MKPQTKHILIAALIGVAAYVLIEVWKAWQAGTRAIADLITAPFTALETVWSSASSAASSVAATVQNVSAGNAAAAQITTMNDSDYAPGGVIYNQIEAQQGQAAADQAWQTVQNQQAAEQAQAVSLLNPTTWF